MRGIRSGWTKSLTMTATLVLVAALGAACGSGSGAAGDGHTLTLVDGAQTLSAFDAPYASYAPTHQWKEDGLDVKVELTSGGTQSAQLVAAGKADVSIVGLSSALAVAAQSPNVTIVAVTGGNLWHLAVPTGSSITSIDQLKGKTIGVQALDTGMYLYNRAALKIDGVDPDKDVKWLPIGTGAQAAEAINSHKVDALATYDGPYEVISGLVDGGMRLLPSPLDSLNGSGAWIVNTAVLKAHRDEVVKFLQGMSKTALVAQNDPQAIIDYLWDKHPDLKPQGVSDADALTQTEALVKAYWSKVANMGPLGSYGVLSDSDIAKAVAFHLDNGIVEGKIDIAKSFDLSVAQDANDYDHAAVVTQAKAAAAKAAAAG